MFAVKLASLLTYFLCCHSANSCEIIRNEECQRILPYNSTSMPNLFSHQNQEEASENLRYQLVNSEDKSRVKLFLCSVHFPICLSTYRNQIQPCSEFCLTTFSSCKKQNCGLTMEINCNLLPRRGESICFSPNKVSDDEDDNCDVIKSRFCGQTLPYNLTLFPNQLNHESQEYAERQVNQFRPLVQANCSPDLKLFLCSVYYPNCDIRKRRPCRRLCESARSGCEPLMKRFGFAWPETLQCDRFPAESLDEPCLANSDYDDYSRLTTDSTNSGIAAKEDIGKPAKKECQLVRFDMCKNLQYNMTIFPNILGHKTQEEAGEALMNYAPLIKVNCSPKARGFFCSLFFPVCTVLQEPIPPCQSDCQLVRDNCGPLMRRFAFDWPTELECSKFPKSSDGLCIEGASDVVTTTSRPPITVPPRTEAPVKDVCTCNNKQQEKCQSLQTAADFCRPLLPYNATLTQNKFGHKNIAEATEKLLALRPLLRTKCSQFLEFYLCSSLYPNCEEDGEAARAKPCRNLCLKVRNDCWQELKMFELLRDELFSCH